MSAVLYPHIELAADGTPWLAGTQMKVVEIVLDRLAHHWDAEEIQRQHPHLGLAQIYAALAYYYDHQSEIDADIERRRQIVEQIRSEQGESSLRQKLQRQGQPG